jgi:hypothetical protein
MISPCSRQHTDFSVAISRAQYQDKFRAMESTSAALQTTFATMTLAILLGVRHCLHLRCLPQQHLARFSPPQTRFPLLLHQLSRFRQQRPYQQQQQQQQQQHPTHIPLLHR